MWKALIKLVESWAYRCEHEWELVSKTNIYDNYRKDMPIIIRKTKSTNF